MTIIKRLGLFEMVVSIVIMVLAGGVAYYLIAVLPNGELRDGERWRVLQSVEADHRNDVNAKNLLLSPVSAEMPYAALGVPTGDPKSAYVWILLEKTEDAPISQIPRNRRVDISCIEVKKVSKELYSYRKVLRFLENNCAEN